MSAATIPNTTPTLPSYVAAYERERVITDLYLAAPDPWPSDEWWSKLLGGRPIAGIPTAELRGIVASLEAQST